MESGVSERSALAIGVSAKRPSASSWKTPAAAQARSRRYVASGLVPSSAATSLADRGPRARTSAMPSRAAAYTACVAMKPDISSRSPTSAGTIRRVRAWRPVRTPVAARATRTGGSLDMGCPLKIVRDADHNGQ